MKPILLTIFFIFLFGVGIQAQSSNRLLKKAEGLSKNLAYADAISTYETLLKDPKGLASEELLIARLGLANAYFLIRDHINAERIYSVALQNNPILKGDNLLAYRRYAQVLSSLGRYSDSKYFWEKYSELYENDKRGLQFAKLYAQIDPLLRNQASYNIEYLGINSGYPDFSPAYFEKGLVFVSGRSPNNIVKRVFKWDNSNFLNLYFLEDLSLLKEKTSTSAVLGVGGNNAMGPTKTTKEHIGKDYYTPPTPNDARTIGQTSNVLKQEAMELPEIPVKSFSKKLNSKYHEGPSVFFDNGKKIILTRNSGTGNSVWGKLKGDGVNRLKLFYAEQKGNDWGNISELPFNNNNFSCGHPTITEDGKLLFFVSDMPGGFGGTDLYYSEFINNQWTNPKNAGPKINTAGDEMFPFLDKSGNLYFSTDGIPGLGALDIFVVALNLESKTPLGPVRNLGAPINSQFDDFGILTDPERLEGYFSSNRKRGGSDDDIYRFTRLGPQYGCRDLVVSIKDTDSKQPIGNARFMYTNLGRSNVAENVTSNKSGIITICLEADQRFNFSFDIEGYESYSEEFSNYESSDYEPSTLNIMLKKKKKEDAIPIEISPKREGRIVQKWSNDKNSFRVVITDGNGEVLAGTRVRFINACTGQVQEMISRKDGTVEFSRDLECDYELVSLKDGYSLSRDIIPKTIKKTIFGKKKVAPESTNLFNTKLYKVGDVIKIENIYYSSDEYQLNTFAKKELSTLVKTLIKYPNMVIEVASHTDTRGNAAVNQILSDKRAQEVYKFLTKSINKNRVRAVGKGETEPVNSCGDGIQCTDLEHSRNRRTEFKILKMDKI